MPVENLARSDIVTATTDESIQEIAATMAAENVGSVVITDGDEPAGIVTDRDLTLQVIAEGESADGMTAEDVMSTDLCTIEHDGGFYEATELMSEHGVRRLPVVDSDGELTGIITVDDLHELLADEHQQLAAVVQAQRPPY
ncbi:CBS domain-containing protein [Natronobacterium gregoryi]|uniref:CBS domain-containing protein n=2 Tax=Natronobacterium gregoryi TaxID=44930 RepID=L0ALY1_NATGS|nr:CBS domain-containing protein [Natronobacterium gregoryi]AFZ74172.1 putative transcriptional regulator, contains C-terminal CBS domains [Natronobacterium gregoryi SP2]ELY63627.1 signal transduction protein with CBS domains [Natronobacterium gregoryi SP2]PLK22035.1 CBS domain-containing protein [Natronobacterium gregoryi SP2]SFI50829.1 CBS domain-containing protein [Natronobacterium gregoryi]